jgi:thioredoxin-related protein
MALTIVVMLLVLSAIGIASELIPFKDTTTSWDNIKTTAAKERKLIFIDAYTDWCSWCKVMDKETFSDTAVANFMNAKFVPVHYEMETGFGLIMSAKYRVSAFPTFLIFTSDGKLVNRIIGYHKSKEFLEELYDALDPSKQDNLTGISALLDPGFPQFYKDSFLKGNLRKRPDSAAVNSFLASAQNLSDEVAWSVLYRFSSLVTDNYKEFVYKNYNMLKKMYGANDVENSINAFLSSDLSSAVKANDESAIERVIAVSEKYVGGPADETRLNYRLRFYRGTKRWTAFANLVDSAKNASASLDENAMNSYSWTIYQQCDDKEVVARATKWMSGVVEKNPKYALLDTYAALLYKSGDLKKAQLYAETAVETGKKDKEDVQETEELLKKINGSLENKP